ncbi:MAG TPA: SDR family oxidoreductase, partial [Pyrinomonadaceae bacterium]|nr:SDR family oxidoreductase [Pyrinomonadaceae bacterium]
HGQIDVLVHAVAYAPREDLEGSFTETSRAGFGVAMDVSAYSLVAMCREATRAGLLGAGASVMTLSYYGAEKVVANYNVMGVAKAALEASTRYLASDLGKHNVRVNAISAGPIQTLAARGVKNLTDMLKHHAATAPLRRNVEPREVGDTALVLCSPLSSGITGEVIHVDCGYNIMAF